MPKTIYKVYKDYGDEIEEDIGFFESLNGAEKFRERELEDWAEKLRNEDNPKYDAVEIIRWTRGSKVRAKNPAGHNRYHKWWSTAWYKIAEEQLYP